MGEYRESDSGNDTVGTHPDLWRPIARHIGGFDLDPAAGCEPSPIADDRYTKEDDGLTSPWYGTVWLNPPFSNKGLWYKRLVDHYNNGDVKRAVALGPGDISTDWFHNWFTTSDKIAFLDGRDWYLAEGNSPTFSTQVGLWNPTPELVEWLHTQGTIVKPQSDSEQRTLL